MNAQVEPRLLKEGLCKTVLNLSKDALAAILVDEKGRVKEMEVCDECTFVEIKPARRAALFEDLALRQMMRREFDNEVGQEEYTLTKRIKMIVISFPISDLLLIVATQPFIDTYHICKKILKTIQKNKA